VGWVNFVYPPLTLDVKGGSTYIVKRGDVIRKIKKAAKEKGLPFEQEELTRHRRQGRPRRHDRQPVIQRHAGRLR